MFFERFGEVVRENETIAKVARGWAFKRTD